MKHPMSKIPPTLPRREQRGEASRKLPNVRPATKGVAVTRPAPKPTTADRLVSPIARRAPKPPTSHFKYGQAYASATYHDAEGRRLFHAYYFVKSGEPQFLTLRRNRSGAFVWAWMSSPSRLPLYGLERLADFPNPRVVFCGTEKTADAATRIFPKCACISAPGGSKELSLVDWAPLAGRAHALIWPTKSESGENYANDVAAILSKLVRHVEIVNVDELSRLEPDTRIGKLRYAHEGPKHWDPATAAKEWQDKGALREAALALAVPFSPPTDMETKPKFALQPFEQIAFDEHREWLIKRFLPRQGVAALYGKPGSYKSFLAQDIAMRVAIGRDWAGRRVARAPVIYIAAEGAAGFAKRKRGLVIGYGDLPSSVPFRFIRKTPNLGTGTADAERLLKDVQAAGFRPGLIVIDTLAATLNGADENGAGMVQFISNVHTLARELRCLVLVVHHVGHGDDKRMRGHSSFAGAADALLLCAGSGRLAAKLTIQKLKEEESHDSFVATLSRVVTGKDEDGEDVSTLVVESVEEAEPSVDGDGERKASGASRLLLEVVAEVIDEAGEAVRPAPGFPTVKGVPEKVVRERFYERVAENAEPDEDPRKLAERLRKAFQRAVNAMMEQKEIGAAEIEARRFFWLLDASRTGQAPP